MFVTALVTTTVMGVSEPAENGVKASKEDKIGNRKKTLVRNISVMSDKTEK